MGEDWVGGVRLENIGVVTDNGWENIYQWPDEEIICPSNQLIHGYYPGKKSVAVLTRC